MRAPRILYVVNVSWAFLSHRLPIARAAREAGYEVHVAAADTGVSSRIEAEGFRFHAVSIERSSIRVDRELATVMALYRLYRAVRPDLVHNLTIKPVLYGGMAARAAGVPAVVSAVPGLGYVFVSDDARARLLRPLARSAYRIALRHPNARVIFQNPDDRDDFIRSGLVDPRDSVLIRGSGVDLQTFRARQEPNHGPPLVVLASRMLWAKGVGEFVDAARRLREEGVRARFALVGDTDPGIPSAVPREQLAAWAESGVVEWWGHRDDMAEVLASSHIVCLPTSYGEGVPKVLIEAAAVGRTIVTSDAPGCREIVRHGTNGLLVPPRDPARLASALRSLIEDPERRRAMGAQGRRIAEAEFSIERVVRETLSVYSELLRT